MKTQEVRIDKLFNTKKGIQNASFICKIHNKESYKKGIIDSYMYRMETINAESRIEYRENGFTCWYDHTGTNAISTTYTFSL